MQSECVGARVFRIRPYDLLWKPGTGTREAAFDRCHSTTESLALWYDTRLSTHRSVILLILRRHLDENISVYLILQTPQLEEPQLKEILERLTVSLEVIAFGSSLQSEHGGESHQQNPYPANRDILWSGQVDTSGQAFKVQEGGERGDAPPRMNLLWKVSAFLSKSVDMSTSSTSTLQSQVAQEYGFNLL